MYFLVLVNQKPRRGHCTWGIVILNLAGLAIERRNCPTISSAGDIDEIVNKSLPRIRIEHLSDTEYSSSLGKLRPEIAVDMSIYMREKRSEYQYAAKTDPRDTYLAAKKTT
jgi:hypothetical protein